MKTIALNRVHLVVFTKWFARHTSILFEIFGVPDPNIVTRCNTNSHLGVHLKCIHTGLPKYLVPFVSPYVCARNTRRSKPGNSFLQKPIYNSSGHKSKKHFDNSFAFDGPDLWNGLSESIRTAPTISSFRSRLKTYLFEQAFPP